MEEFDWHKVWERKGLLATDDLGVLDGYEYTEITPEEVAQRITKILDIKKEDRILEVGCGAGAVAAYLDCHYVGIDYSFPLVKKHIKILNHQVLYGEANNLIFKDKSFDKVFCFSVFQYFPGKDYALQTMAEMKRVARISVLICDLALKSHRKEHFVYEKSDFEGWEISEGFHASNGSLRFNARFDLGTKNPISGKELDKRWLTISSL